MLQEFRRPILALTTIASGIALSACNSDRRSPDLTARMSPELVRQFDEIVEAQYRQCWHYLGPDIPDYKPAVQITLDIDGRLVGDPVLVNRPSGPSQSALADQALKAVQQCRLLVVPARFKPYHTMWQRRTLRFDTVKSDVT